MRADFSRTLYAMPFFSSVPSRAPMTPPPTASRLLAALLGGFLLGGFLLAALGPAALHAQDLPSIAEKTEGAERQDGFLPLYWDAAAGSLYLEIPQLDEELLHVVSLPAGLGSNDVGLDRGQLGGQQVVRFERVGTKVLMVAPNLGARATTDNAAERRAVADAFAEGVVWGFTAVAATDGRVLVDATDFVLHDAHGIADRLRQTGQGSFALDKSRSAVYPPATKAFPQNTELEARLTFTSSDPGGYVRQVAAVPEAVTLRQRHSFVQLPDTAGFERRRFDPRSGFFGTQYEDYAVPIGQDITQRYVTRHRLQCAGAPDTEGLCAPSEPIVYYLDPGTPEPVRSALLDGARWWNQAFEAAGYRDAFRVEMLPADADPMDVRYNVIQWVHRATRGWSYGASVVDPRTGEILKGHVTLGSRRVRQDYLLAEGMLAPYTGDDARGFAPADDPMLQMALARIRQLSAHEVGHTLGLAHNFAASTTERASVMDYPAPLVTVAGNRAVLDEAYDTGIGAWDEVAVRYGYTDLGSAPDPQARLDAILTEARQQGLRYVTDRDARPGGAAHPYGNLWENGPDMVAALEREMDVRRVALDRFGPEVIRSGEPLALMEEVLVPLYLRHRYQVDATAKLLGGVQYRYALRGEEAVSPQPVAAARQRAALDALLATLSPEALRLPEAARQILPRPPGYGNSRELFDGYTGLTFDPYAPAEVAAQMVLEALVHPERAARLAIQDDFADGLPTLGDVLGAVTDRVWTAATPAAPYDAALQRVVQRVWTDVLLDAAARKDLSPFVRAGMHRHLEALADRLGEEAGDDEADAFRRAAVAQINRFLNRPYDADQEPAVLRTPPGSPIGQGMPGYLQRSQTRRTLADRWAPIPSCSAGL